MTTKSHQYEQFNQAGAVIIVAFVLFLIFNLSTTIDTFLMLFPKTFILVVLGIAFSLIDFSGLARVMAKSDNPQEEKSMKWLLTIVWLMAVAADFWLTVVWARIRFAHSYTATLVDSGILHPNEVGYLPIMIATFEATMRIALVFALSQYGERLFKTKKERVVKMMDKSHPLFDQKRPEPSIKTQRQFTQRK